MDFATALVTATGFVQLEKAEQEESSSESPSNGGANSITRLKNFASGIKQNIKDRESETSVKDLAHGLPADTKDKMKSVVNSMVNDGWVANIVGQVADKLEQAQGDLGWSGAIPVPLEPYRSVAETASKILP